MIKKIWSLQRQIDDRFLIYFTQHMDTKQHIDKFFIRILSLYSQ